MDGHAGKRAPEPRAPAGAKGGGTCQKQFLDATAEIRKSSAQKCSKPGRLTGIERPAESRRFTPLPFVTTPISSIGTPASPAARTTAAHFSGGTVNASS